MTQMLQSTAGISWNILRPYPWIICIIPIFKVLGVTNSSVDQAGITRGWCGQMGSDKMGLSWFSPKTVGLTNKKIPKGFLVTPPSPFQELWCSPGIWKSLPRVKICIPAPLTGLKSLEKRTRLLSCWGCPSNLSSWGSDRSREGFSCRSPGCGGGTAKLCREGWINADKIPLITGKKQ